MIDAIHLIFITALGHITATLLKFFTKKEKKFYLDGGMPSAHSATVSSLSTGVYFFDGFSLLFAVTLFFSYIVIHDSMNLRRQVGYHAEKINKLSKSKLKTNTGHTPVEVAAGIFVGVTVAIIYSQFL